MACEGAWPSPDGCWCCSRDAAVGAKLAACLGNLSLSCDEAVRRGCVGKTLDDGAVSPNLSAGNMMSNTTALATQAVLSPGGRPPSSSTTTTTTTTPATVVIAKGEKIRPVTAGAATRSEIGVAGRACGVLGLVVVIMALAFAS